MRFLANILWIIPFGLQFFKIALLALRPFGAIVVREHVL